MRFLCKWTLAISFALSIFFTNSVQPSLNNLKGTYSHLNPEQRHLSLIHGAVAWETGVIRQMYDYGRIFPKIENVLRSNEESRKTIVGYDKLEETSAVIRLIHALFYRVPETTTVTDFAETQYVKDNCNIPETIANIIKIYLWLKENDNQFLEILKGIGPNRRNQKWRILNISLIRLLKPTISANLYASIQQNILKILKGTNDDPLIIFLKEYFDNVIRFGKLFKGMIPSLNKDNTVFEHIILLALRECDQLNIEKQLYPEHMVLCIFQAFLYKNVVIIEMILRHITRLWVFSYQITGKGIFFLKFHEKMHL